MTSGKERLLERARAAVPATPVDALARSLASGRPPLVLDVREPDEVALGRIPGAKHVSRGLLELRIEGLAGLEDPIVLYCATGTRSLLAARTLQEMGYGQVSSLEGGVEAWKASGRALDVPESLSPEARRRYARHLTLPEVGEAGQLRLRAARVLVIGAGGLGSPVALYLAAAGVGTLGIVDDDVVDVGNLQRQILHRTPDAGSPKVESARRTLTDLNPETRVETFSTRFRDDNAEEILARGWDVVVDGTDLVRARYAIGDACVRAQLPVVHGAIHRFEGQVSVFFPARGGPCYRCLFPVPPPTSAVPSCAEAGVLGTLPGVIGTLQAMETLKLLLEIGSPLVGRILRYDALAGCFDELRLPRDPDCPACGVAQVGGTGVAVMTGG